VILSVSWEAGGETAIKLDNSSTQWDEGEDCNY